MTETNLNRLGDNDPWTPYVIISYRLNPADIVGTYSTNRIETQTKRGVRVYNSVEQRWERESTVDDYAQYAMRFQRVDHGNANIRIIQTIPDSFVVVIGILKHELHENIFCGGETQEYENLFEELYHLGFDPLKPIRKQIKTLSQELGVEIRKAIDGKHGVSKSNIIEVLKSIGERWCGDVRDYILGGAKPSLHQITVEKIRPEKQKSYPELYGGSRGLAEPLFETGQLHDAISFDVVAYQSETMTSNSSAIASRVKEMCAPMYRRRERVAREKIEAHIWRDVNRKIDAMRSRGYRSPLTNKQIFERVAPTYRGIRGFAELKTFFEKHQRGTIAFNKKGEKSPMIVRRVPEHPTDEQIASLEKKTLRFLGLRKFNIVRKRDAIKKHMNRLERSSRADTDIMKARIKLLKQEYAEVNAKISDLRRKARSRGFRWAGSELVPIGQLQVARSGKNAEVSSRIETIGDNPEMFVSGVLSKYKKLKSRGKTESEIELELIQDHLSMKDVRLAKRMFDILSMYGRDIS